jgi:hypothetical protein
MRTSLFDSPVPLAVRGATHRFDSPSEAPLTGSTRRGSSTTRLDSPNFRLKTGESSREDKRPRPVETVSRAPNPDGPAAAVIEAASERG